MENLDGKASVLVDGTGIDSYSHSMPVSPSMPRQKPSNICRAIALPEDAWPSTQLSHSWLLPLLPQWTHEAIARAIIVVI